MSPRSREVRARPARAAPQARTRIRSHAEAYEEIVTMNVNLTAARGSVAVPAGSETAILIGRALSSGRALEHWLARKACKL